MYIFEILLLDDPGEPEKAIRFWVSEETFEDAVQEVAGLDEGFNDWDACNIRKMNHDEELQFEDLDDDGREYDLVQCVSDWLDQWEAEGDWKGRVFCSEH